MQPSHSLLASYKYKNNVRKQLISSKSRVRMTCKVKDHDLYKASTSKFHSCPICNHRVTSLQIQEQFVRNILIKGKDDPQGQKVMTFTRLPLTGFTVDSGVSRWTYTGVAKWFVGTGGSVQTGVIQAIILI